MARIPKRPIDRPSRLQISKWVVYVSLHHNKLLPPLFDDYFIQGKTIHDHYTRSSYKYRPLKARTII